MPIYEYKCKTCDHTFEKLQSFSAGQFQSCPRCGQSAERCISLGSFILKGGGWYATDHASKARRDTQTPQQPACEKSCDNCPAAAS